MLWLRCLSCEAFCLIFGKITHVENRGILEALWKIEAEMGARDKNCLWHLGGSRIYVELQPPWTLDLLVQLQTSLLEASCGNTTVTWNITDTLFMNLCYARELNLRKIDSILTVINVPFLCSSSPLVHNFSFCFHPQLPSPCCLADRILPIKWQTY